MLPFEGPVAHYTRKKKRALARMPVLQKVPGYLLKFSEMATATAF
jgi:hypothetical protein